MSESLSTSHDQERVTYIDMLRIIACFLVIVNHTNSEIFLTSTPSFKWFFSLTYLFVSKSAVPIFLMITGYTMLYKQDNYKKMFMRFMRYGFVLLFFSGVYYIFYGIDALNVKTFIKQIIYNPVTNAFWYMYLYLGIILMMPFLQKMVLNFSKIDYYVYFFWALLLFAVWPILVHYFPALDITERFSVPIFSSYICMLLMGGYVKRYGVPLQKYRIVYIIGMVLSWIFSVLMTYYEYIRCDGNDYLYYDKNMLLPTLVSSFCMFNIVATIKIGKRTQKIISKIGKLTFGIYLISDLIIGELKFLYYQTLIHGVHPIPAVICFEVIIFIVAAIIIWILKKIPIIKKIL